MPKNNSDKTLKRPVEDDSRNFGTVLHDVARLMRIGYDRRMKPLGLTRSQWWVLARLYFNEGKSQSELAALLDIEKATLGRLLDRLEKKGWVVRIPDTEDRRTNRVHLTDKIEPMMKEMRYHAAETNSEALSGLTEAERERVIDALIKIRNDLIGAYGPSTAANTKQSNDTDD